MSYFSHPTSGGHAGHVLRRLIHVVLIGGVPWLYYDWFFPIFSHTTIPVTVVLTIVGVIVMTDFIRAYNHWVLFAQRDHEASHFSSFAWAALAMGVLLLASPGKMITIPIAMNCALVDPLIGELRAFKIHSKIIFSVGVLISMIIWGVCAQIFCFFCVRRFPA